VAVAARSAAVQQAAHSKAMLLFAYGTLKDEVQLRALLGSSARYRVVGAGSVRGVLYDVRGEYPALRPAVAEEDVVSGVVLELDDTLLERLDAYEGVGEGLYVRERCTVRLDDGRSAEAWVYLYNRPTTSLRRIAAWPPGG
jgi:gamma-glutamylcyclotransferase (GGCT)/AIG2-like uncharacterized protein YtfP